MSVAVLGAMVGCSNPGSDEGHAGGGTPEEVHNQVEADRQAEAIRDGAEKGPEKGPEKGTEQSAEKGAEAAVASVKEMGPWVAGDEMLPGRDGVANIKILEVHANGSGEVCGTGKLAEVRYKAMKRDGTVLDPGTRPYKFRVGAGNVIKGWDVVVAKMRVGDSFTLVIPQELAYGPSEGDLKFDMELLGFE